MDLSAITLAQAASAGWLGLNSTQWTGVVAYGFAAGACGLRARRGGGWGWWAAAAVFTGLASEVLLGWRHGLSGLLSDTLSRMGLRESRRGIQAAVLACMAVVALGGLVVLNAVVMRRAGAGFRMAVSAAAVGVGVGVVEVLSLHQVDAVLYARVWGDLRAIALVWIACAGAAVVGAVMGGGRTAA